MSATAKPTAVMMAASVHRLPASKPASGYRVVAAKGSDEATIYVYGLIGA